ncbi:MAG: HK97 family phage prohead protease [Paracoccaceae bacterium]
MTNDALTRAAQTRPNSFDPATRTVSAVIASPTPVPRRDSRGPFLEVLTADTLDLSAADLPVLDSHRTASVRDQLGRVRSIAVEGDSVVAVLWLSSAEDVAPVVQRIADGTVTGVSIGYRVAGWTEKQTQAGRVKSPTAWTITEVTLTSNPADPSARLRHQEESPMPEATETVSPDVAEQTRRRDIRALVRTAGLDAQVADDLIDAGADMTRAKAEIFDAVQDRRRAAPIIRSHAPANDDPATIIRRQSDALAFRMGGGGEPAADVRPFLNLSLRDMAVDSLTRAGVSTRGMSADEVFTRAGEHTTSDFALTVSNAMNKVALDTYRAAESPLKTLCRQRTLPNFKDATSIRLGEMGRLEELAESGEITHTSRAESGETMRLKTFARGVTVSRKLMIDDDLGLLGDMTAALGEAAAQTEADILVALLTGNPNLSDGNPVFHASRGNIGTADGPSVASLTESRLAMRTRKGLDGATIIAAAPRYVLVPATLETDAEQVLASIQPSTVDDVNPFGGKLSLLVEPRLTGETWYVFADPARLAAMQYAYLSSAQGVQIQRTEAWDTLGMKFRAFLDFGAGWLDWRGAHRIPG